MGKRIAMKKHVGNELSNEEKATWEHSCQIQNAFVEDFLDHKDKRCIWRLGELARFDREHGIADWTAPDKLKPMN